MDSGIPHAKLLAGFHRARVLVIGDLMLDRQAVGVVERISPEAPVPVLRLASETATLGGAGNVVRNLAALGAGATLLSVVGDDPDARAIAAELEKIVGITSGLIAEAGRVTTVKHRFIAGGQQLLRTDREVATAIASSSARTLVRRFRSALRDHDLVVISDYGKGVITPDLAQTIIAGAAASGLPVLVDPKGSSYEKYRGAYLVTPNSRELAQASGLPVDTDEDVATAARQLAARFELGGVLATRGGRGMTLVLREQPEVHLKAEAKEVFDVTGAGDTVIAMLAAGLSSGSPIGEAAFTANVAAGIAVGKLGVATVLPTEIVTRLTERALAVSTSKVVTLEQLEARVAQYRPLGMRIGFTNGCFDLLHPGHLSILQQARSACDLLVVGVNSDASVRRLKGRNRPIQDETSRVAVLASLSCVDQVVVFDEDTPLELIERVRPDVLVKGADYTIDQVVGAPFVQSYGGTVVLVHVAPGFSTTSTIERVLSQAQASSDGSAAAARAGD